MMLCIARKNQVDMTTEPSGVLTGEEDFGGTLKKMNKPKSTLLSIYTSFCLIHFIIIIS